MKWRKYNHVCVHVPNRLKEIHAYLSFFAGHYILAYQHGFHSVEELVVSVEDQLGRELPLNRLTAILEIFLQLVAVRLEALLKRCGDLVSDLHLLEGFLYFTFEKLLWLQEITCLQT